MNILWIAAAFVVGAWFGFLVASMLAAGGDKHDRGSRPD